MAWLQGHMGCAHTRGAAWAHGGSEATQHLHGSTAGRGLSGPRAPECYRGTPRQTRVQTCAHTHTCTRRWQGRPSATHEKQRFVSRRRVLCPSARCRATARWDSRSPGPAQPQGGVLSRSQDRARPGTAAPGTAPWARASALWGGADA